MPFYSTLPRLTSPVCFDPENAQIDKLELMLGEWIIIGPRDEVSNTLQSIATLEYDNPAWPHRLIFQSGYLSTQDKCGLKFRGTGTGRGTVGRPRLLFSGKMEVQPLSRQQDSRREVARSSRLGSIEQVAVRLRLDLKLNLIRFIQAQPLSIRPRRRNGTRARSPVLAIMPTSEFSRGERPLVFDTNVLIGGPARSRFINSKNWSGHLADYFGALIQLFENGFQSATEESVCQLRRGNYLAIRKLEVCWEFRSDSPIEDVVSVGSILERRSTSTDVRTIELGGVTSDARGMSRRFAVDLGNSARLRIYPKTTQRVRFEVAHNARSLSNLLTHRSYAGEDQLHRLTEWVETAISSSIERSSPSLEGLGASTRPAMGLLPPHRLIHRICTVTNERAVSGALIDALVRESCIRLNDLNPFAPEVKKLVKLGVLKPVPNRARVWVVTARYENALRILQS